MAFKLLGGGSDLNTVVNDMNQNILELKNREVTEIFKDNQGTRRVILDNNGLRTSPVGVDVVTASADQLTFNSSQNALKVVSTGTFTLPVAGTGSYNLPLVHGLGYPPIIIASVQTPFSGIDYEMLPYNNFDTSTNYQYVRASVSDTQVLFTVQLGSSTGSGFFGDYLFRYRLLQETAN